MPPVVAFTTLLLSPTIPIDAGLLLATGVGPTGVPPPGFTGVASLDLLQPKELKQQDINKINNEFFMVNNLKFREEINLP
jgi:hypothetical protein